MRYGLDRLYQARFDRSRRGAERAVTAPVEKTVCMKIQYTECRAFVDGLGQNRSKHGIVAAWLPAHAFVDPAHVLQVVRLFFTHRVPTNGGIS